VNIPCARRLVERFNKSPPIAASGRFDLGADRWLSDDVANHRDKLGWLHRLREKAVALLGARWQFREVTGHY
jgi:hypothetical protein